MSDAGGADNRVWIERTKWPDRPQSRALGYLLGEDEHGAWVGLPAGHDVYRGDAVLYTGPNPVVSCIPRDEWWVANWYGRTVELFIDVVAPARWRGDTVSVVDLDFGVMVKEGEARLVDAELFEEHRLLYEYPSSIEAGARRAAAELEERACSGHPPFSIDLAVGWFAILRSVSSGARDDRN